MSPVSKKMYTTEVICLRAIEYGEADKVLHFYSPEYGRLSAIAKGVKKPNSKMAGACELMNVSEVQLAHGKNLDVLCQYQPRETFVGVRSDILKLAYGQLFLALIQAAATDVDTDSHEVYGGLKQALKLLDQAEPEEIVPLALDYQLNLLHAAGFHPVLSECIFTGDPLPPEALYYCFSPELGGVTLPEHKRKAQMESGGSQAMQWVNVSTSTLQVLANPHQPGWTPGQLLKAQKFLQYYFRQVFEKQLHAYALVFSLLESGLDVSQAQPDSLASPA